MKIKVSLTLLTLLLVSAVEAQPTFIKSIPYSSANFTRVGNYVYYMAGDSLFRTDGTEAGTIFLKGGVPLEFSSRLMQFNDLLIFVAIGANQSREMWRSDGTVFGTFFLKSTPNRTLTIHGVAGNYIYFTASDPGVGSELYRSDGTASGTILLKDINPGNGNAFPAGLAAVGDQFFFKANDAVHGYELWKTNGTTSGTVMVKDIVPGQGSGIGEGIAKAFNGKLFFSGVSPTTGAEAWVSDGTSAGTVLLKDLIPGASYPGFIEYADDNDGWLYFFSSPARNFEEEAPSVTVDFWRTDGSTSGTTKIKSFTRCASCDYQYDYWVAHDKLYFFFNEGDDRDGGYDRDVLYASDGTTTGTIPVFSLPNSGGRFIGELNGDLLFLSPAYEVLTSLYRTDGTLAGTEIVRSFNSSNFSVGRNSEDIDIVAINDKVYFPDHDAPFDPSGGYAAEDFYQLMESDGSTTKSIRSMGGGSFAGSNDLVELNDRLIFTTGEIFGNTSTKKKLWVLDPSQPIGSRGSFTLVNADSDQDIQILHDGDVVHLTRDQNYNIRFDPVSTPGSVVFKHQGKVVRRETAAPYSLAGDNSGNYLAWNEATAGSHRIEAIPYSGPNGTGTAAPSLVVTFTFSDENVVCNGGSILREYWQGIPGNQVSSIPLNTPPTGTSQLTAFEGPQNSGTNYGARIRGYICPPVSGNYVFWIASNDESELWLSDGDDPADKQKIAFTKYATDPRQWDKYPSQRSAEIPLVKGTRYYVEALHKQGGGTDHIAVGWQLPGGGLMGPIDGYYLSPFSGQLSSTVEITTPTEGQEFTAPAEIVIGGTITGRGWSAIKIFSGEKQLVEMGSGPTFSYQWNRVPPGRYALKAVATNDVGQTFESGVVNITVNSPCSASGTITREQWNNRPGNRVTDIPLSEDPSGVTSLTAFETQSLGTNYGARIRGFICPPQTGDYIFWIASNDHSELWMSTDDDPLKRRRIAYVSGATDFRQWNKFATQKSAPIQLTQGKRYYIEALHKQGVGTDHLSVGWQLPDGTMERPMGGGRLSPFGEQSSGLSQLIGPVAGAADIDPLVVKLEARMIADGSRYSVEVSADPMFGHDVKTVTSATDYQTIFIMKDLSSATRYYARVKTDASDFGPVTSFTTRNAISRMRLWGMTSSGGMDNMGTVFSYSIDDHEFVKHYDNPLYYDGYDYIEVPLFGSLVAGPDGKFYGHMEYAYGGDMFEVNSQGDLSWWNNGAYFEQAQKTLASNNLIYSANTDGMVPAAIDAYDPERRTLLLDSRMHFFGQNSAPDSPLLELADGYMYGVAADGGVNEGGSIFRFRLDGTDFKVLHYFADAETGRKPHAGLTEYNGFLYGTTTGGGQHGGHGTIFRMRPNATEFTVVHEFDGVRGSVPRSELIVLNDVMYGTTNEGGSSGKGTVFRINPDGTGFSVLHSFNGADGAQPSRGVVHDRDGNLFGITTYGGTNNMGVIYKVKSTTSAFAKLFDLSQSTGGRTSGGLVIREDTYVPASGIASETQSADVAMGVSIYPNPTTDNFELLISAPEGSTPRISVMDQYGEIVGAYDITVGEMMQIGKEFKKGIYILKISDGKMTTMHRLVKK